MSEEIERMVWWFPDVHADVPTFADYGINYMALGLNDFLDRCCAREALYAVRHGFSVLE